MPDGSPAPITPADAATLYGALTGNGSAHLSNLPPVRDVVDMLSAVLDGPDAAAAAQGAHTALLTYALRDDDDRAASRTKLEGFVRLWDEQRPEIQDEEQAKKATDLAGRIGAALKAEEDARKVAKRPYLDGGKAIDKAYDGRGAALEKGLGDNKRGTGLRGRLLRFALRREREEAARRLAAQAEAERLARAAQEREDHLRQVAEAAAQGAPVDPATLAQERAEAEELRRRQSQALAATAADPDAGRVRTDYGSLATMQRRWNVVVTDAAAIPRKYLIPDTACIDAALRADPAIAEAMRAGNEARVADLCAALIPGAALKAEAIVTVR